MSVILFYSPFIYRSRDTESLMLAFRGRGHKVLSLSQESGAEIHEFLKTKGIQTFSHEIKGKKHALYFIRQFMYLVWFCHTRRVDIIYSHLEPANFVAAFTQFFVRAKVFICRHHISEAAMSGFDRSYSYRLTYALARRVIVVSQAAKKYMAQHEKVRNEKIIHINLAYDFSLYQFPVTTHVDQIRSTHKADILLVCACRFNALKRPETAVKLTKLLVDDGASVKLILLGTGELENILRQLIVDLKLEETVFLPGYVRNILDYFAAADFLVHPSLSESSCVVVKEAGLVRLPVIVCHGVGDFDDYLEHGRNAFQVEPGVFEQEAFRLITLNWQNNQLLKEMGDNLHSEVKRLFDVGRIAPLYDQFNSKSKGS